MRSNLPDLDVLIVDCQTTGGSAQRCQVVEVAWRLGPALGPEKVSRGFLCALPEDIPLPRRVQELTGLRREDLKGAPSPAEVMESLARDLRLAACPPRWFVAHGSAFEARFLDPLLASLVVSRPAWLCTQQLSQWLLPELPSYTLRAVAGHLGYSMQQQRRAVAHVEATLTVWRALCDLLEAQGIRDPSELEEGLAQARQKARPAPGRRFLLPRDIRRRVPDEPGVYRFEDARGTLLYVGKAARLRSRVGSYVGSPRGKAAHTREMLAQAARVEFTVTASVMEAALLEARTIQELSPPYNRMLRPSERPVVYASTDLRARSHEFSAHCPLGPFSSSVPVLAGQAVLSLARGEAPGTEAMEALVGPGFPVSAKTALELPSALGGLGVGPQAEVIRLLALGWTTQERHRQIQEEEELPEEPEEESSEAVVLLRRCLSAAKHLYRSWRRAATCSLLRRCTVVFQPLVRAWDEPRRALVLESGLVVDAVDLAGGQDPPLPPSSLLPLSIDRAEFDRLGVLVAELRRQSASGHPAWLLLPPGQRMDSRSLEKWLEAGDLGT
jgi:DNA polymerase III epsilon subunit-like protein